MPDLWSLLHTPPVELLGWTLLHFVWQGALVAAVLAGALFLLRDHSPRVRYALSCAALLGLLALPLGTGVVLSSGVGPSSSPMGAADLPTTVEAVRAAGTGAAVGNGSSWRAWAAAQVQPALPWIVLAWGLGVLACAVRLGGGAWRVRRLRRTSTPVPTEWRDRLQVLADRMGVGTRVELRRSERVDGPMLAGWCRPVILVPTGFLAGLPPSQVEALLLHELAHVRRHDVLVGRLQAVVETLLFFHPATWWISQQVRRAREVCCDDLVVQAGSDRRVYAQALSTLAERVLYGSPAAWTPGATGGTLLERIRRLVAPTDAPAPAGRRLSIVAAALLMVLVPAGLAACASQQSTTEGEPAPAVATEAPGEPSETKTPPAPHAPSAQAQEEAVIVIRDDSTEQRIHLGTKGPVEVEGLDENVYVFRYGNRVDTVEVPDPETFRPPVSPDSMARIFRMRFGPDSLERVLRARINPDSIERALHTRFSPDSLEQHALRLRGYADSLVHRFSAEQFDHWPEGDSPDSTFVFAFDDFDREDFGMALNVDSLLRWHSEHADSLRRHLDRVRERMHEERSKHLREQARRLREQAERLEERAEEMEASPDSSG